METQVSLKEYVDQRFLDQETAVKAALTSAEPLKYLRTTIKIGDQMPMSGAALCLTGSVTF
jgi:hypothetical protein